MWKKWLFIVWAAVLFWSPVAQILAQEANTAAVEEETVAAEGDEGTADESEVEVGPLGDEEGVESIREVREEGVLSGAWRALRAQQRHLTGSQEDAGLPLGGILALFLVLYILVVLGVLTSWRRAHTPTFRAQRAEEMGGSGRWLSTIAYTVRRRVDARLELRMTGVEPEGTAAELAYLVDGQIKGRLGPGAEAHLDFPGLRPKSFWQKDQQEVIPLGFELIQPRERAITVHIEGRVEYTVGSRKGTGGELRQVLKFTPAVVGGFLGLKPAEGATADTVEAPSVDSTQFGEPAVMPLAAPVSSPGTSASATLDSSVQLADRAAESANLAAERALSNLEEFGRRREEIDRRLSALEARGESSSGGGGRGRDHEIKALEERLGADLRENIQAVMAQVDDLRSEISSLRALIGDLAQRVP